MQGLWDGFEGRGFAPWLPSFYDAVLNAASSEARWCATALPDSHPGLLLQLLNALFSRIDKPFRTRLASALVQGLSMCYYNIYLRSSLPPGILDLRIAPSVYRASLGGTMGRIAGATAPDFTGEV